MTMPHLELLAADRGRELRREAAARLVAPARCSRPSTRARAGRRATAAAAALRGSLHRDGSATEPCCA